MKPKMYSNSSGSLLPGTIGIAYLPVMPVCGAASRPGGEPGSPRLAHVEELNTSLLHCRNLSTQEVGDSHSLHQVHMVQGSAILQQADEAQKGLRIEPEKS